MTSEDRDLLLSQLADGELASDQANEVLLGVLNDPEARQKLGELLRLRQATAGWRTQQPPRPVVVMGEKPGPVRGSRFGGRLAGYAVAAGLGGLLVLAGFYAAGPRGASNPPSSGVVARAPAVTAEQMRQVARVFALHESVAGPLAWYAADDRQIRMASAQAGDAGQAAIAVLLRLGSTGPGDAARTLVIVCREQQPAVIELPADSPGRSGLRVYLSPRAVNGKVEMQYAIAVEGDAQQPAQASLAGQRNVGLAETSLGQVALGDTLLNVDAAAWPMKEQAN